MNSAAMPLRPSRASTSIGAGSQTASASAALAALPALGADALDLRPPQAQRGQASIGGWYGKSDLWRLVQVARWKSSPSADPTRKCSPKAVRVA